MCIRYKLIALFIPFVGLLFIQACSDSVSLTHIPHDGVIVAFGDSLTVGVGTSEAYSYPAVLSELSNRQVISAGISGEETSQGLTRLPTVLDEVQPNLVVLLEGGNDILRNRNAVTIKNNLAKMIGIIKSRNIEVVLIGVPEKKLFSNVAPLYEELAQEHNVVLLGAVLSDLLRDNDYKSDAVHLNEQGYRLLAESIHELLVEKGALSH